MNWTEPLGWPSKTVIEPPDPIGTVVRLATVCPVAKFRFETLLDEPVGISVRNPLFVPCVTVAFATMATALLGTVSLPQNVPVTVTAVLLPAATPVGRVSLMRHGASGT